MPTVWILPSANTVRSEMFSAASWLVTLPGQADTREPDVGVYDVSLGPLSDDFRAFCQMKFFPLLVLAAIWDLAWAAIEGGADDAIVGPIASDVVLFRARRLVRAAQIIRVEDLIIDLGAQPVARGNRLIKDSL